MQQINIPVAVDGKIFVSVNGGEEQEIEMHSLVRNMLHFWALNTKFFGGVGLAKTSFQHAISFAYNNTATYETNYLGESTPMSTDFSCDNGNTIIATSELNPDGTKTVSVRKAFTNISGAEKVINCLYLVSYSGYPYIIAKDDASITVQPNNNLNVRYDISMSKEFTNNMKEMFLGLFKTGVNMTSITNTQLTASSFVANTDGLGGGGLVVGSDNTPITGSENVLRSPISTASLVPSEQFNAIYPPLTGSHNGYLKKTRIFTNNTASSIVIGEVAHYMPITYPSTNLVMSMIKAFDAPIEVLAGESVEISVDYALTI